MTRGLQAALHVMDPAHLEEIERVLLYVSEARERAERVARAIRRDGGEPDLVEAVEEAERALSEIHLRLLRRSYFGIPSGQLELM